MLSTAPTGARKLRDRLTHPITGADGRRSESLPLMREGFDAAVVLARGAS